MIVYNASYNALLLNYSGYTVLIFTVASLLHTTSGYHCLVEVARVLQNEFYLVPNAGRVRHFFEITLGIVGRTFQYRGRKRGWYDCSVEVSGKVARPSKKYGGHQPRPLHARNPYNMAVLYHTYLFLNQLC